MSATFVARFPAMSALIDGDGKVHYLTGHTGDYLEPTRGVPSNDLLAMARQGLWMPLRLAIHQALAGNCEITASAHVRRGSGMHPARLVVTPVGLEGAPRRLLVAFFECENGINPEDHAKASRNDIDLMAELVATHEDLRLSLDQMELANEALHVSNEEIRLINQGLARSNAKLKNILEETQVLNENLKVNNDDLQSKFALLEQRASDLSNFLHGSDLAALFLDRELHIRWFTPSVRALVNLAEIDIGRPIAHFAQQFTGSDLIEDVKRVLAGGSTIEAEVLSNHGRWYVRCVSPYHAEDGRTLGVAVTFADVTQRKQAEDALFREKDRAEITLRSIADAVITTTEREIVDFLNPAAEALTGWRLAEAAGQSLDAVFQTIDERTGQPLDSLARRCLGGGSFAGSGHSLLISRDGSQIPIQDSAAPIRNGEGTVVGAVLVFRDVTEVRRLARDAAHEATHDPLTGLLNRRELEKRLDRSLVTAATLGSQHALCFIDLDGFKVVNDTAGHTAGDELLNQVASLLAHACRSRDTLARIGGDEFCLLMEHCSLDDAVGVATAILSAVQNHRFVWDEHAFSVGVSIGIVAIDRRIANSRQCLTDADTACYKAKRKGGNQIEITETTADTLGQHPEYSIQIGDIYRAIDGESFRLFHQPIHYVGPERRQINMHEVLLRLLDERGALVTPGAFVPVAERYGMMPAIDRWVIRETFRQAARSMRQDSTRIININLSGQTINDETLLAYIMSNLAETKFPVDRLCLEITETAAIGSFSQASNFVDTLRQLGCRFALDDFGKGVSSLTYLKHLKVDYVKIDGSFVLNMARDATDRALVSAINQLAHALGIETIAECAETAELIEALTDVGVDYVQGFAIGEPRPLGAAVAGGPLSAVRGTRTDRMGA